MARTPSAPQMWSAAPNPTPAETVLAAAASTPRPRVSRRTPSAAPRRRLAGIAEGAAYADIGVRTLRRYISEGRIPGYRVGPRLVKVDLDDLDALARRIPTVGGGAA